MPPLTFRLLPHGFFITGTDTGVGKTLVACALLHAFAQQGLRAVGMKPIAAGAVEEGGKLINDDVELLRRAGNVEAPLALVNPYCFKPPIAPHIAAQQADVSIDIKRITQAYGELAAAADVVIIEGVGGFCVPLNRDDDTGDLAQKLDLPLILVVGMRLGCLNHALLTAQAISARGLTLAGWVANRIDSSMIAPDENIATLNSRLAVPLLAEIEFSIAPDPQLVAARLSLSSFA